MEELSRIKPCPFCGSIDNVTCTKEVSSADHYVGCDSCDVTGPRRDSYIEAIAAWNRRRSEK